VIQEARIDVTEKAIKLEVEDRTNADGALSSKITQTAEAIMTEVSKADGQLSSRITQTATAIQTEVTDRQSADGQLSSRITQTSEAITAEVERATGVEGTLSGRITVASDKVSLVVKENAGEYVIDTASIVLGINNQSGSYVKIKAKTIDLDGYVTASELNVTTAKIDNLMAGNTTAAWIKANQGNIPKLTVGNDLTFKSHGVYWQGVNINGTNYHFMGYVG
jgi:hypothetical protein